MSRVVYARAPRLACWGAQAASLQISAACRDREMTSPENCMAKDVAGRAAGNYRLAACAPKKHARPETRPLFNHRGCRFSGHLFLQDRFAQPLMQFVNDLLD